MRAASPVSRGCWLAEEDDIVGRHRLKICKVWSGEEVVGSFKKLSSVPILLCPARRRTAVKHGAAAGAHRDQRSLKGASGGRSDPSRPLPQRMSRGRRGHASGLARSAAAHWFGGGKARSVYQLARRRDGGCRYAPQVGAERADALSKNQRVAWLNSAREIRPVAIKFNPTCPPQYQNAAARPAS